MSSKHKKNLKKVKKNGLELQFIESQTTELCMAAVKEDGRALQYVKRQTPEICMAAVKEFGLTIKHVKPELRTPEICLEAVKKNPITLKALEDHEITPEICMEAVTKIPNMFRYVEPDMQTPEMCLEVVKKDSSMYLMVRKDLQTLEMKIIAVNNNLELLGYIEDVIEPDLLVSVIWTHYNRLKENMNNEDIANTIRLSALPRYELDYDDLLDIIKIIEKPVTIETVLNNGMALIQLLDNVNPIEYIKLLDKIEEENIELTKYQKTYLELLGM